MTAGTNLAENKLMSWTPVAFPSRPSRYVCAVDFLSASVRSAAELYDFSIAVVSDGLPSTTVF